MLYFRALQAGLATLPAADPALRAALDARARRDGWPALHRELAARRSGGRGAHPPQRRAAHPARARGARADRHAAQPAAAPGPQGRERRRVPEARARAARASEPRRRPRAALRRDARGRARRRGRGAARDAATSTPNFRRCGRSVTGSCGRTSPGSATSPPRAAPRSAPPASSPSASTPGCGPSRRRSGSPGAARRWPGSSRGGSRRGPAVHLGLRIAVLVFLSTDPHVRLVAARTWPRGPGKARTAAVFCRRKTRRYDHGQRPVPAGPLSERAAQGARAGSIYLVNGIKLQGQIDSFDQFVVLLKNSVSQMVYKHAISTVVPARNVRLPSAEGGEGAVEEPVVE